MMINNDKVMDRLEPEKIIHCQTPEEYKEISLKHGPFLTDRMGRIVTVDETLITWGFTWTDLINYMKNEKKVSQ